jgi:hypothetical protein
MKYIISVLLIVLAVSGYMALTTDYRFKSAQAECQPAIEVHFEELAPAAPVEITPEPPPPEPPPEEIKDSEMEDEYSDKQVSPAEEPEDLPDYSSNNSIETEIADVFGSEYKIAMAIAKAESGLNPGAVNRNKDGSKDIGIFQINDRHGWSDEDRLDWKTNIRIAKELRDSRGWSEWAVYKNGTYRNYL